MKKANEIRGQYMNQFARTNPPVQAVTGDDETDELIKTVGEKIYELMRKEDLTYDIAYASLQYSYNLMQYNSNFLKLK